jgi:hypothetical protein
MTNIWQQLYTLETLKSFGNNQVEGNVKKIQERMLILLKAQMEQVT